MDGSSFEQHQKYFRCFDSLPATVRQYLWSVASPGLELFTVSHGSGLYDFAVMVAEASVPLLKCESPIEQLLLFVLNVKAKAGLIPGLSQVIAQGLVPACGKKYRGDIVIEFSPGFLDRPVIVECDGHEFHEKTREQVARDKARQRDLQIDGYHVIRFAGSEVFKDPAACAGDVLRFIQRLKES